MVKYDSGSSTLVFSHVIPRENAEPYRSVDLAVDLKSLPENIRQLVIIAAKLSSSHAADQKVKSSAKDTAEGGKKPSFVGDKFVAAIASFGKSSTEESPETGPKTE